MTGPQLEGRIQSAMAGDKSPLTRQAPSRILLLTGLPGVGKTTIMRRVADSLEGKSISGFLTEEIRERGQRKGFGIETFDGERAVLAHVDIRSAHRVGKYGVDVSAMDRIATHLLAADRQVEVYLIDEIGKMECYSARFVAVMKSLLDSGARVIATVPLRAGGFSREVRARLDVESWEVTRKNREEMADKVAGWVSGPRTETGPRSVSGTDPG